MVSGAQETTDIGDGNAVRAGASGAQAATREVAASPSLRRSIMLPEQHVKDGFADESAGRIESGAGQKGCGDVLGFDVVAAGRHRLLLVEVEAARAHPHL